MNNFSKGSPMTKFSNSFSKFPAILATVAASKIIAAKRKGWDRRLWK